MNRSPAATAKTVISARSSAVTAIFSFSMLGSAPPTAVMAARRLRPLFFCVTPTTLISSSVSQTTLPLPPSLHDRTVMGTPHACASATLRS